MTTNGVPTEQVRKYLEGVASACADLHPADRDRLLSGLDEHLAELNADGVDLITELGDPAAYAGELRATAGLLARHDAQAPGLQATATRPLAGPSGLPGPQRTSRAGLVIALVVAAMVLAVLAVLGVALGGLFLVRGSDAEVTGPEPAVSVQAPVPEPSPTANPTP